MAKQKTNDQMLKAFLKEVSEDGLVTCVLRERLQGMAAMTKEAMKKKPESFHVAGIFKPAHYQKFIDLVEKHLGE